MNCWSVEQREQRENSIYEYGIGWSDRKLYNPQNKGELEPIGVWFCEEISILNIVGTFTDVKDFYEISLRQEDFPGELDLHIETIYSDKWTQIEKKY